MTLNTHMESLFKREDRYLGREALERQIYGQEIEVHNEESARKGLLSTCNYPFVFYNTVSVSQLLLFN